MAQYGNSTEDTKTEDFLRKVTEGGGRQFQLENMERIFKAAKVHELEIFISPHYFYPTNKGWKFNGPLETDEATYGLFARKGVLNLDGLEGSDADWLECFKPYIDDRRVEN